MNGEPCLPSAPRRDASALNLALPNSPRQLRWLLARRLGAAAIVIGVVAGSTTYLIETGRVAHAAEESAASGARHFESPSMQLLFAGQAVVEHDSLARLLDRARFVGIRLYGLDRERVFETWAEVPALLREAANPERHEWPEPGSVHRLWIDVGSERLIQVVKPLTGNQGQLVGYLESVTRLDSDTLRAQRNQIRGSVLTAVTAVLVTALLLYPLLLAMLRHSGNLSRRLLDANLSLLSALGNAVAKRDSDTDAHNYRVTFYAVALAEAIGTPPREIASLVVGAFLHDIGKIGIPDRILLKPGKLSIDEFEVMKSHVHLGLDIVADDRWLVDALPVIRHHHERYDGNGYPDALRGKAIPVAARIFAVADVFDALTSARPYKSPMPVGDALHILTQESGHHFDPAMVAVFAEIAPLVNAQFVVADAAELRLRMRLLLTRYFEMEAAPEGAANRSGLGET